MINKEIKNRFLMVDLPKTFVKVPSIDCLLGDKLTAFAPHTIAIPFNVGKELEIIKQLNDIASLSKEFSDFCIVKQTYLKVSEIEIGFRGISADFKVCLVVTMQACLSIMSKGKILKEDYALYLNGIRRIKGHMIGYKYNPDIAVEQASIVLYMCCCIYADSEFNHNIDIQNYKSISKLPNELKSLFYLKKFNIKAFSNLCESLKLVSLHKLL